MVLRVVLIFRLLSYDFFCITAQKTPFFFASPHLIFVPPVSKRLRCPIEPPRIPVSGISSRVNPHPVCKGTAFPPPRQNLDRVFSSPFEKTRSITTKMLFGSISWMIDRCYMICHAVILVICQNRFRVCQTPPLKELIPLVTQKSNVKLILTK